MEKGRIQVYAKKCIKLCKSNRYRVEFSNTQLEFKNTFNERRTGHKGCETIINIMELGYNLANMISV